MLKLTVVLEEKTPDQLQLALEYIAHQVGMGYVAGVGWVIQGESEEQSSDDED